MSKRTMTARLASVSLLVVAVSLVSGRAWAMDDGLEARIKGMLLVAGWIDKLLLATLLLSALVLVRRFSPNAEFELPLTKINVPIGSLALCFAGLTITHGYLAWLFYEHALSFVNEVRRIHPLAQSIMKSSGCPAISDEAKTVFDLAFTTISTQGGPLWNGLKESRVEFASDGKCVTSSISLVFGDPPSWLYIAGLTVMLLSMVKAYFIGSTWRSRLLYLGVAAALVTINWQIGSFWVGSTLALDSVSPSRFFLSWPVSRVLIP